MLSYDRQSIYYLCARFICVLRITIQRCNEEIIIITIYTTTESYPCISTVGQYFLFHVAIPKRASNVNRKKDQSLATLSALSRPYKPFDSLFPSVYDEHCPCPPLAITPHFKRNIIYCSTKLRLRFLRLLENSEAAFVSVFKSKSQKK